MPDAEERARDRRERIGREMECRQRDGESRILHADFDCQRAAFRRVEAAKSRESPAGRHAEEIVKDDRDKDESPRLAEPQRPRPPLPRRRAPSHNL